MLIYEILLTRICSLRLFFHFGFLIISNCLLGIGASGTLISLYQESWRKRQRFWITLFSSIYLVSLVVSYVLLLTMRIKSNLNLSNPADFFQFSVFNLIASLPFFFVGTVIGMILTFNAARVNTLYFFDLLGAGIGCLLCPLLLWKWGAGGSFVFLALLALLALMVAFPPDRRKAAFPVLIALGVAGLWLLPRLDAIFPVPGKDILDITDKARIPINISEYSRWSSNSRIDLIPVAEKQRLIFGVGKNTSDLPPIPPEKLISQDGSAMTFIVNFSEHPEGLRIIERSMYSAAMHLKERPRVFIIGVGGGNDVWAAKIHDASYVKGVELNQPTLDIHREVLPHYSRGLLEDSRIELVCAEGRSALMRETDTYDVIQMTGVDTWTALTSGSYVMAEDYLYTRQAIESMYSHLADEGIMQIIRFAGNAEALRMLSNIYAAFENRGIPDFEKSIICLTDGFLMCFLAKKGIFSQSEVVKAEDFAKKLGLGRAYLPYRFTDSFPESFITSKDKEDFIQSTSANISPTTDDKPYFFFFSKWPNPFSPSDYTWKPNTIFEVKPGFILFQLLCSSLLGIILIILPLVIFMRKGIELTGFMRFLVYFAGLGFGFIMIEIAAMQKLTLFLGHPLYSITVTLFSVLIFTGLGSQLSGSRFEALSKRLWVVPAGLTLLLIAFIFISPQLVNLFIHFPLPVRIAITVLVLAPISMMLGVPFPYGIRLLNVQNPSIIPWAWAVNGCCTVIGAIVAVILSMQFGFTIVLIAAGLIYVVAFSAIRGSG